MAAHTKAIGTGSTRLTVATSLVVAIGLVSAQAPTPQRIVSIVPSVTQILFAIGAESQLVGIGSFDQLPNDYDHTTKLARVGTLLDPDMERIFTLRPDLVVLYKSHVDQREQLERAGIPVLAYEHAGLADISPTIRSLGVRTGRTVQAKTITARMAADLASIRARVNNRPKPRTLLVFSREPMALRNIYASGGIGFLHDMLDAAGGKNVFENIKRENIAQVSSEAILAAAPDVIIEIRAEYLREDAVDDEPEVWRRLSTLPAVRNGRIHSVTGNHFVVPGPGVIEATEELARVLHPEAFTSELNRPHRSTNPQTQPGPSAE
jgi:iron complex transport system substrate-binding protein